MKCKICQREFKNRYYNEIYCGDTCRMAGLRANTRKRTNRWYRRTSLKMAKTCKRRKVKCLICRGYYRSVAAHVHPIHGITSREYREKFGLLRKDPLQHKSVSKLRRKISIENMTPERLEKFLKASEKTRFKKGAPGLHVKTPGRYAGLRNVMRHRGIIQKNRTARRKEKQEKLEELRSKFGIELINLKNSLIEN